MYCGYGGGGGGGGGGGSGISIGSGLHIHQHHDHYRRRLAWATTVGDDGDEGQEEAAMSSTSVCALRLCY